MREHYLPDPHKSLFSEMFAEVFYRDSLAVAIRLAHPIDEIWQSPNLTRPSEPGRDN